MSTLLDLDSESRHSTWCRLRLQKTGRTYPHGGRIRDIYILYSIGVRHQLTFDLDLFSRLSPRGRLTTVVRTNVPVASYTVGPPVTHPSWRKLVTFSHGSLSRRSSNRQPASKLSDGDPCTCPNGGPSRDTSFQIRVWYRLPLTSTQYLTKSQVSILIPIVRTLNSHDQLHSRGPGEPSTKSTVLVTVCPVIDSGLPTIKTQTSVLVSVTRTVDPHRDGRVLSREVTTLSGQNCEGQF